MCGRYRLSRPKYLVEYFDAEAEEEDFSCQLQHCPTQAVATVRSGAAKRVLSNMRWGLIPWWAKDIAIGSRMINAVARRCGGMRLFGIPSASGDA